MCEYQLRRGLAAAHPILLTQPAKSLQERLLMLLPLLLPLLPTLLLLKPLLLLTSQMATLGHNWGGFAPPDPPETWGAPPPQTLWEVPWDPRWGGGRGAPGGLGSTFGPEDKIL